MQLINVREINNNNVRMGQMFGAKTETAAVFRAFFMVLV